MNYYMEVMFIRGNGTIEGVFDYLNLLERRINYNLKHSDDAYVSFEKTDDDESGKFINYCLFDVPEWLKMGRNIEEWLVYALSLEMTNFYLNSRERV